MGLARRGPRSGAPRLDDDVPRLHPHAGVVDPIGIPSQLVAQLRQTSRCKHGFPGEQLLPRHRGAQPEDREVDLTLGCRKF